jgi:U3 small nucleolar RNA-associated protein 25
MTLLEFFTPLQSKLFPIINEYYDLFFAQRSLQNAAEVRDLYLLHAWNHVLKYNVLDVLLLTVCRTRDRVLKNNAKLNAADPAARGKMYVLKPILDIVLEISITS